MKGDIHYRFVIDVPQNLNEEQQEGCRRALKDDGRRPAQRLFPNGAGAKDTAATGSATGGES